MPAALEKVRIVLVETAGELNLGAIARAMKNMGLRRLVLVNPQGDRFSAAAKQMAVHAADILENAQIVPDLPSALQGCDRAIATTARPRTLETPLEAPRAALPWLLEGAGESALIFGREASGLTNAELNYAQRFVGIPSHPDYPSLNLAQAVAICCYELYQSTQTVTTSSAPELAALEDMEGYYQHLERVLLKIGYLYPHTAASRMEKFRQLFKRSQMSSAEVAMLRGILRQMEWALLSGEKEQSI